MSRAGRITPEEKIAFLRDPGSYPGRAGIVTCIETHFAWVFLTARHAYKLKKPLRHGAMDYRSLKSREHGCREELRLNRRLAPDVYLAVVPLVHCNGRLALEEDGRVVDWLVKMRRLPASRMLDRILARRPPRSDELERLVGFLARFFSGADPAPMAGGRYLLRLASQIAANRRAMTKARRDVDQQRADAVTRQQRRFVRRARRSLAARGARLLEGHGDLRAGHVCLGPPVCVIDCLEFDRELRRLDSIEEVAFLSLEIERLGHPKIAVELVRRFRAATGDPVEEAVVSFYRSHRAATRATLAVWHLGDAQFPDPQPWIRRANSYLRDAECHASRALGQLAAGRSGRVDGGPALEQRRKRHAARHARDRLAEERRDRQYRHPVGT